MAESDLNYIKTILRSVLTSCPSNMTIKQVLADYVNLEGSHIPYKELGFKTIFELLETMKDVLQIPYHPNMNSLVKLVIDEKSSHLRDLVVNQKNQKKCKKEFPNKSYHLKNMYNTNIKKLSTTNYNVPNYIFNTYNECNNNANAACGHTNNTTSVSDYNAFKYNNSTYDVSRNKPRGYNFVKKKSYKSQKGVVTKELKKYIENLCNSSQNISIFVLKSYLIHHPDYKKLNTINIEEAIRMLKFFIYINNGIVYLKDSPNEIFSNNNSYLKDKNPTHINYTQNIVDENEEILYSTNDMEDISDYDLMEYSVTNNDNTNKSYMNNSYSLEVQEKTDSSNDKEIKCNTHEVQQENNKEIKCDTLEVQQKNNKEIKCDTLEVQQNNNKEIKCDTLEVQQKNKEIKCHTLEVQQKNNKEIKCDTLEVQQNNNKEIKCDTFEVQQNINKEIKCDTLEIQQNNNKEIKCDTLEVQQKNENSLNISEVLNVEPLHNNTKLEIESQNNGNKTWILKSSEKDGIDYISLIISIIETSTIPITVKNVMDNFQIQHGYSFPHKKFFCRTCMDFFRLYPSFFILDDHYSTNSIVRVNKKDVPKQHFKLRESIVEASIFKNDIHNCLEGINILPDYMSKLNFANNNSQEHNNEKQSKKLKCSYESLDSNKILNSMKIKMRSVLNKYKNGILCDEFMDVYAKEYGSHFMFTDYGFKSMRDMAYKLPSVFYVKMVDERDECILYSTYRRVELECDVNDPSLFYKNIPRTVLNNLSIFFNNYRTGIRLDELMQLYCAEFGRSYEPLKYGYSSEKHMFESLYKMVRIQNNVLYTVDPFAYRYFVENNECVVNNTTPALPINNYLLNYTGNDVCNGKFQYTEVQLPNQNTINVVAAEIYNVCTFYLNLCSNMNMLNNLMSDLQCFYELNENKYQINPELLIPGLACTSRFENSMKWHRAKILKVVDELNVKVIYVDYGSVETIAKTDVRLLDRKFGFMHTQGIACSLFEDNEFNRTYPLQINRMFASLIDGNVLKARFNPLKSKNSNKRIVTLCLKSEKGPININKKCSLAMKCNNNKISIRRRITQMYD